MGMAMPEQGVCMYQMDLEGHGYSGGERAYIEDYNHWVDDYRQVRGKGLWLVAVMIAVKGAVNVLRVNDTRVMSENRWDTRVTLARAVNG